MNKIASTLICLMLISIPFLSLQAGSWSPTEPQFDPGQNVLRNSGLGENNPVVTTAGIINWFLTILGVLAVVLIIYGGFVWMMSRGDDEDIKKAKDVIIGALIGLAVVLASYGIANYIFDKTLQATGA